jgi:ubiquitin carboxyl-terminal hydrolase 7
MAARQNDLRLYLDVISDPSKVSPVAISDYLGLTEANQPEPPAGSIMIFLKHFDTSKQTLYGVGKCYVQRNSKVGDLCSLINEKMRWTPGTPLKLYEVNNSH